MFNMAAFLAYVFITSFTPGPNNIMAMSNASRLGFKKSIPFCAGVMAGFTVVMLLSALFGSLLYAIIPTVKPYMLVLGALYILWLAWKTFKSSGVQESKNEHSSLLSGALLQFVNPKAIIYGITCMSAYILPYYQAPVTLMLFSALLGIVALLSTMSWALFGSAFKRLFAEHAKVINVIMALLLVYCAVSLFL